jgi:UDP-N-acetylmuramoyl-L-alanyl-D-glutamate--2,6-diaminopimelate ligase
MRDGGARAAAIEVSSHSLVQHRVAGVSFDVAVFTNFSRDHLDYHGSHEAYAAAKLRLFADPNLSVAIVNFDDPFCRRILDTLSEEARVFGYAASERATDIELAKYPSVSGRLRTVKRDGLTMVIDTPFGVGEITVPVFGEFNAANVLAVLATMLALDVPYDAVIERVAQLRPVPGRFELLGARGDPLVVVDYAHSPDALEQALISLRTLTEGDVCCVFGCGGDRDPGKRELMGRIAEQHADRVVITSDNPRSENPEGIAQQILAGCRRPAAVHVEHDRAQAIASAIAGAGPKDAVLVAGKGHETYQEIGGERRPFDDRALVTRLLAGGPL